MFMEIAIKMHKYKSEQLNAITKTLFYQLFEMYYNIHS